MMKRLFYSSAGILALFVSGCRTVVPDTAGVKETAAVMQQLAPEMLAKAARHPGRIALVISGDVQQISEADSGVPAGRKDAGGEVPATAAENDIQVSRVNWITGQVEHFSVKELIASNRRVEKKLMAPEFAPANGSPQKRRMQLYFQSYLQKYSRFIAVVDPRNGIDGIMSAIDHPDVAGNIFFLTVIIGDVEETSGTVPTGNTRVIIKNYSLKMVANLRDCNGNVLFATDVIAKKSCLFTNVTRVRGINYNDDLMEDGWKQIADKVGAYFVTELNFKIKGPQGDDSFDADDVTVCVDGKEVDGESCKVLAYNHTITAECEGCQSIERKVEIKAGETAGAKTVKLNFKKAKNNRKF